MRETKQVRGRRVVRVVLPICLLAAGATVALRCTSGRKVGSDVEVRQSALLPATSIGWWRVHQGPWYAGSLASILTASRGTETFSFALQVLGSNYFGAFRTHSNIETTWGNQFTYAGSADNNSMAASSSDGGNTIDIFWRNTDQTIGTLTWDGTTFSHPANVPQYGLVLGGLGAGARSNRTDIFGVGTDRNIYQNWRGTGGWVQWSNIGSPPGTWSPAGGLDSLQPAVVWLPLPNDPNSLLTLQVFAVALDGHVWTRRNENSWDWLDWDPLYGNAWSGIAATFSGTNEVDIFTVNGGGFIDWNTSSDGGQHWYGWTPLNPPAAGVMTTTVEGITRYVTPTAIAHPGGGMTIDLFVRDANGDDQLMTIRPPDLVRGYKERSIAAAAPTCTNLTDGFGEDTAVSVTSGTSGYEILSMGDWQLLRVPEESFFDNPTPSSCTDPSGDSIPTIAPLQQRFGTEIATPALCPQAGAVHCIRDYSQDNQIARLSNGHLISLRHYGICSDHACSNPPGTACANHASATSADLIFRSIDGGSSWSYTAMIDPCDQLDPDGSHDCYAVNCSGTGTDRPEMTARGTDLFVTEGIQVSNPPPSWPAAMTRAVWKSSNEGLTWTEWVPSPSARIVSEPPVEITTVGTHLVSLGRRSDQVTVTLWAQSKDDITVAPRETVLFSDLNTVNYGDNPSIIQSSLGIAQASSSLDGGDYVRIVYPVLLQPGSRQAARTGIVRVNSDQTATIVANSFVTVQASSPTGSVVYPTLVEADRAAPLSDGDERPPVVLHWVETSNTPDPSTSSICVHLPGCDWGDVSTKAIVFRGVNQSSTATLDTAHSHRFKGNGDYVHGSSRYAVGGFDRFFLHWFNQNNAADNASVVRVPTARILDVTR